MIGLRRDTYASKQRLSRVYTQHRRLHRGLRLNVALLRRPA